MISIIAFQQKIKISFTSKYLKPFPYMLPKIQL